LNEVSLNGRDLLSPPLPGAIKVEMWDGVPERYNSILPSGVHESGLGDAWLGRSCSGRPLPSAGAH